MKIKEFFNRAKKSLTVWTGGAIVAATSVPMIADVVVPVIQDLDPALAVKITAAAMLATRLRSILVGLSQLKL